MKLGEWQLELELDPPPLPLLHLCGALGRQKIRK